MKLALVTETFPPEINGVAMTFGMISRELARYGNEVTVYRPARADRNADSTCDYQEVDMPGFPIPGYPLLRMGFPAKNYLTRAWSKSRPDLVHVVTEGPLGSSAIATARALNIPVTSSFHTNFHAYTKHYGFGPLRRFALAWLRRCHNRTRRTFAPTEELCHELKRLGFEHLGLLSRGVDIELFSPARRSEELRRSWGANPEDVVVVHAGRLAPEKNYTLLFKAYEAMAAADPRCRFIVVGDGPLRTTLAQSKLNVRFTGFVARDDLARHYASADVYIHASLTETFGNVVTEALASGLAFAGFNYAAARQFIVHEYHGLTAPCSDPNALIAAAVRLISDEPLRTRLAKGARRAVEPQSWDQVVRRFESDLTAVIAQYPTT